MAPLSLTIFVAGFLLVIPSLLHAVLDTPFYSGAAYLLMFLQDMATLISVDPELGSLGFGWLHYTGGALGNWQLSGIACFTPRFWGDLVPVALDFLTPLLIMVGSLSVRMLANVIRLPRIPPWKLMVNYVMSLSVVPILHSTLSFFDCRKDRVLGSPVTECYSANAWLAFGLAMGVAFVTLPLWRDAMVMPRRIVGVLLLHLISSTKIVDVGLSVGLYWLFWQALMYLRMENRIQIAWCSWMFILTAIIVIGGEYQQTLIWVSLVSLAVALFLGIRYMDQVLRPAQDEAGSKRQGAKRNGKKAVGGEPSEGVGSPMRELGVVVLDETLCHPDSAWPTLGVNESRQDDMRLPRVPSRLSIAPDFVFPGKFHHNVPEPPTNLQTTSTAVITPSRGSESSAPVELSGATGGSAFKPLNAARNRTQSLKIAVPPGSPLTTLVPPPPPPPPPPPADRASLKLPKKSGTAGHNKTSHLKVPHGAISVATPLPVPRQGVTFGPARTRNPYQGINVARSTPPSHHSAESAQPRRGSLLSAIRDKNYSLRHVSFSRSSGKREHRVSGGGMLSALRSALSARREALEVTSDRSKPSADSVAEEWE